MFGIEEKVLFLQQKYSLKRVSFENIERTNNMKKRILSTVAILSLLFGPMSIQTAKSQIVIQFPEEEGDDIEVVDEIDDERNEEISDEGLELPQVVTPGITIDSYAPLGSEVFVLGLLGGAYLLGKRRRKE